VLGLACGPKGLAPESYYRLWEAKTMWGGGGGGGGAQGLEDIKGNPSILVQLNAWDLG
jgi:hypothetical protein